MTQKKLSIYIHIPFCIKKCAYCDFLSAPADNAVKERYVHSLCAEIGEWGESMTEYEVDTVFFGGGTPSCLRTGLLEKILCKIKNSFSVSKEPEITVEVNPKTADRTKLESFRAAGVNRLSIGLQSPFDEDLRTLGRIHSYHDFLSTYSMARESGFLNINIDMMSALPGQTVGRYKKGLQQVAELNPEHISAYSLMLEEGTPFHERYADHEELLPGEDEERLMYEQTKTLLAQYGYGRYEISNYAKKGCECRHNLVYWQGGDYLGMGLGASSKLGNRRFKGTDSLADYLAGHSYQQIQILSQKEQMEEFMFLGLRCMAGVGEREFYNRFHVTMDSVYREQLDGLQRQQLIKWETDTAKEADENSKIWKLTERGIDVSNTVFVELLLD